MDKSAYLITGRAGSGKSTVAAELTRRGHLAFDADEIPNLCGWRDILTDQPVVITDTTFVDIDRYGWMWDGTVLESFLRTHSPVFICGGAHNDLSFAHLFEAAFVLDVSPTTQANRLRTRTNNDYGNDPRMYEKIARDQAVHLRSALAEGHTRLDAELPVRTIVDQILDRA